MKDPELNLKFISFEKENNLFKLKDNNGIYIWDIIRFDIYVNMMWDYKTNVLVKRDIKEIFSRTLFTLTGVLKYFLASKESENFFYLCSRNKLHGQMFDQNAYAVVNSFDIDKSYFFESNSITRENLLLNSSVYNFPQLYHRKFYKTTSVFDYSIIVEKMNQCFGSCPFSAQQLKVIVDSFLSDVAFFTKLFKQKKIKRVFVTQNGLQKGLFFAARKLGIPTFEFQHGIVDTGHLAYHYPNLPLNKEQVYLPDHIFSFSDFWFKNLHVPNVKILPLGNNYFAKKIGKIRTDITSIIIVSANIYGPALEKFLLSNITIAGMKERTIYFKLHPNQFQEKPYYTSKFENYPNIEVISDEYSVNDLLERCQILLTVQSTAVYEALQAGRKVVLLKEGTYKRSDDLLDHPDVYLVGNKQEFEYALDVPIKNEQGTLFFADYDSNVLKKALVNDHV